MKLAWQVHLVDDSERGGTFMVGYGPTSQAALASLYAEIDKRATDAATQAANITAAMVKVRGELEALDAA